MITKIKAIPRELAGRLKRAVESNVSSVYGDFNNILMVSCNCSDHEILYKTTSRTVGLRFDDTDPKACQVVSHLNGDVFFSSAQAMEVLDFIDYWHMKSENSLLLVHCHAGVCRSGAIASFAQFRCQVNGYMFQADNPQIAPNRWVEQKMYEALDIKEPRTITKEGLWKESDGGVLVCQSKS